MDFILKSTTCYTNYFDVINESVKNNDVSFPIAKKT